MSLTQPRSTFGVHSVTPYSRTTAEPYGIFKVLGGSSISLETELIDLFGGSNRYAWASEVGTTTAKMSLKFKELPNFAFTLFLGKAPTDNAAETGGAVSIAFANKYGTSAKHATTGIATALVKSGQTATLKFQKYVVKVISATTVDVFAYTDLDFARGTDSEYQTDLLKITSSALTITASSATEIPGTGIEFTGGSGTIGMTTGDTATFETRPINTDSMEVVIGAATDTNPEFGCLVAAAKRGTGEMFYIDAYRCLAAGLPIGFEEKVWAEYESTVKLLFDSAQSGVFRIHTVVPTTV